MHNKVQYNFTGTILLTSRKVQRLVHPIKLLDVATNNDWYMALTLWSAAIFRLQFKLLLQIVVLHGEEMRVKIKTN